MIFKLEGQTNLSRGYIVDIPNDSTIRFYSGYIPIDKITAVDISGKKSQSHWTLTLEWDGKTVAGREFEVPLE